MMFNFLLLMYFSSEKVNLINTLERSKWKVSWETDDGKNKKKKLRRNGNFYVKSVWDRFI